MEEVWKVVCKKSSRNYEVSTCGNVRYVDNFGRVRNLKPHTNKQGYCVYYFANNGKYCHLAHRLVAIAFIPNRQKKQIVDHIDGNKSNNNVENLRWATVAENNSNPNTQRRPKLVLENKIDKRTLSRERPHNDFSNEAEWNALWIDKLSKKDIFRLSDDKTYYLKFSDNHKVINACSMIARFAKETKSKIKAHRDYENQIVKVVVEHIVRLTD